MSGKIFKESIDIYQDQARVLYDYYRKAAVQIVTEEMQLEGEITKTAEILRQTQRQIDALKPRKIVSFAAAGALLLLCLIPNGWPIGVILALAGVGYGLYVGSQSNTLVGQLVETTRVQEQFKTSHREIRRDYKVHKLGLAYVPVARQIPFEGKSFLIDLTDSIAKQEFRLSLVRRGELFSNTIGELQEMLREAPMVEGSSDVEQVQTDQYSRSIQTVTYYDYLGSLDRALRTATFCLQDLDTTSVELPTIPPQSEAAEYLGAHSTDDPGGLPVFTPFSVERFDSELETFRSLNEMKKSLERNSIQFEKVLRNLMLDTAHAVQQVSRLKVASTSALMESSNRLLFAILKAPYNHYSPKLEFEEIERIRMESFDYQESVESSQPFQLKNSSRVLYDAVSESWVAEDGSRTTAPFGISQIHEEIMAPIIQNLMAETRIERLKIYNSIKDQKINYLNQWHQDTEAFYGRNRAESSDLVNLMRSSFSEFVANYNALSALEKTERNMASSASSADTVTRVEGNTSDVVASYELKSREFQAVQEDFSDYMERLKEDIDRRAAKYGFIEYYDASLRDGNAKSLAQATAQAHALEDRRKALLTVNAYYAAASELPPPPVVEAGAYETLSLNLETIAREALAELDAEAKRTPEPSLDAAKFAMASAGQ